MCAQNGPQSIEPEEETQEPEHHCHTCDCVIHDGCSIVGPDDNERCEQCHDERYGTCERCEETVRHSSLSEVGDQQWCRDCRQFHSFRCCECGGRFRDDDGVSCNAGYICQSCYEEDYFTCEGCGEVRHNDVYYEDGYCDDCRRDEDEDDGILDYDTDVVSALRPRFDPRLNLLGVELEVESKYASSACEDAMGCREALGESFAITKRDGSLGDGGFEIVTIPATLQSQREHWGKFFSRVPTGLTSWENGNCGMHVHASRAPLSQLTIGKILEFVNASANESFITRIAGRKSSSWSKFCDKHVSDARKYDSDRYQALNLRNSATVEFRIFKGTLKPSGFMKNLEFVAAIIRFCSLAGIRQLSVADFLAWFLDVRKDFPALDSWLFSHGFIPARSKTRKAVSSCA